MKELTIEQKAQRYDEALTKARNIVNSINVGLIGKDSFEAVFPELKEDEESRDEKIRKKLLSSFKGIMADADEDELWYGLPYNDILAWLEKQSTPQVRTGLEWANTIDDACDKKYSEEYTHGEYCHEQSFKWGFFEGVDWLEKQGEEKQTLCDKCKKAQPSHSCQDITALGRCALEHEQKPTNKVKPKFHEGDIIRHKKQGFTCKIIAVNTEYRLSECNGTHLPFDSQDAYELVEQKPTNNQFTPEQAGVLDKHIDKFLEQKPSWSEDDELHIRELESLVKQVWATAEHENDKDTIHKMSDLSFFLKTLKPQLKHEWSEEDEKYISSIIKMVEHCSFSSIGGITKAAAIDWLKFPKEYVQPKQEWGEDDEQYLLVCKNALAKYQVTDKWDSNIISQWLDNKLKSLKPQSKQDWSEEDEKIYQSIMDDTVQENQLDDKQTNWLRDIKYRNQWKPSDEQMEAVKCAALDVSKFSSRS